MINNIAELKELADWCKSRKIKSLKIDEIHLEFSDLAFIEELTDIQAQSHAQLSVDENNFQNIQAETDEEDSLLFHSSQP